MELAKPSIFSLNFLKVGLIPKEIFLFLAFTGPFSVLCTENCFSVNFLCLSVTAGYRKWERRGQMSALCLVLS